MQQTGSKRAQEKQFTNLIVGIVKIQFHLITIINVKNVKSITQIQGDIAKQIVNQHEEMEQLLKGLGLKKDLSYYSYNIMEQEGH